MQSTASVHSGTDPLEELEDEVEELEDEAIPDELDVDDMPEVLEEEEEPFTPIVPPVVGSSPHPAVKTATPAIKPNSKPMRPRPKMLAAIRPPMNKRSLQELGLMRKIRDECGEEDMPEFLAGAAGE